MKKVSNIINGNYQEKMNHDNELKKEQRRLREEEIQRLRERKKA